VRVRYEDTKVPYLVPARAATYTPDFILPNGIIIETKGRLTAADRKKHIHIRRSNPELDIRFVFQAPNAKIYKGSKTTCARWAEKNDFLWAKGYIPREWINE
jgi:hypothetical protein